MADNEIHLDGARVGIEYDSLRSMIIYRNIETDDVLLESWCEGGLQSGDCLTPGGIVRPHIDLSRVSWWKRLLGTVWRLLKPSEKKR